MLVTYLAQFVEPIDHITTHHEDHSTYGWFTKDEVKELQEEIVAEECLNHPGGGDDPEYLTMLRGFELHEGGELRFKQGPNFVPASCMRRQGAGRPNTQSPYRK